MSGMPGPWSVATTETPWRSPFWTRLSVISPFLAYIRMLRAISEIAAAMTVCSPLENPATAANARPCCRASTTSTSAAIDRRSSSPTGGAARLPWLGFERAFFGAAIQEGEALLEVQHGRDALERQAELHHRERDVGLDADDHRLGAAQPRHVRDVAQRADRERVHHVECRDVHNDAAAARAPDLGDQRFAEMGKIGVGEGRLNGSDEKLPLPQNWYFHCASAGGWGSYRVDSGAISRTCVAGTDRSASSRAASSIPPCRSPTVAISLRSTPMVTRVWAISGDRPVTITVAPNRRDASTVWTKWLATPESMAATPVTSITTTLARLARIARNSCSVSWRARCGSMTPMMGRMSSRSRTCNTGVDSSRIASCCCRMMRSRSSTNPTATVFAMRFAAGS